MSAALDPDSFEEAVAEICRADRRYHPQAYLHVRAGLDFTVRQQEQTGGGRRHVSGQQLLDGLRQHTLQEYGPLSRQLLEFWGVHTGRDFGEIVFNLVRKNVLGKTAEDRVEDFDGGCDFKEAFERPFEPRRRAPARQPRRAKGK